MFDLRGTYALKGAIEREFKCNEIVRGDSGHLDDASGASGHLNDAREAWGAAFGKDLQAKSIAGKYEARSFGLDGLIEREMALEVAECWGLVF
jgi:hypothetical protein